MGNRENLRQWDASKLLLSLKKHTYYHLLEYWDQLLQHPQNSWWYPIVVPLYQQLKISKIIRILKLFRWVKPVEGFGFVRANNLSDKDNCFGDLEFKFWAFLSASFGGVPLLILDFIFQHTFIASWSTSVARAHTTCVTLFVLFGLCWLLLSQLWIMYLN